MAEQAKEHTRIEAPVEECFDTLTDFESYPQWAGDLKEAKIIERDDDDRAARGRVPGRGDGAEHDVPVALRLLRCSQPSRLAPRRRRHPTGAGWRLRAAARRGRRRCDRRQLRAVDRLDHAHSGVREASGRGSHPEDGARRVEGARRACALARVGRPRRRPERRRPCAFCSSPGRAASARRRSPPRRRCAVPTTGPARSCSRPIPRTRWATRSTRGSVLRPPNSRPPCSPNNSTRRSAWRSTGARSRTISSRSSTGPVPRESKPKNCRFLPGSTSCSAWLTSRRTPSRANGMS